MRFLLVPSSVSLTGSYDNVNLVNAPSGLTDVQSIELLDNNFIRKLDIGTGRIEVNVNFILLDDEETATGEMNYAGAYDAGDTYSGGLASFSDVVSSGGNYYVALQAVPIATPPPNATYWKLLAEETTNPAPTGMVLLTCTCRYNYDDYLTPNNFTIFIDQEQDATVTPPTTTTTFREFNYPSPGDIPNLATFFGGGFGVDIVNGTAGPVFWPKSDIIKLYGTYDIVTVAQWTLETPRLPVEEGTEVTVTSDPDDPDALDFEQVLTVTLQFIDENGDPQTVNIPAEQWTTIQTNLFVFEVSLGGFQPQVIGIYITSTQFSGSVLLGYLATIYFISATGIYKLVTDKRSDTLYVEADPGETVNVAIPDPNFKTGYIGG